MPNELSHTKHFFKPAVFQLIYHVTYACNAHCPFCIHRSYLNARMKEELTLDEVRQIASHLPNFPWLLLTGGEPFIRPNLHEVAEIFCRTCRVSHVTLTTNGMYTDKVVAFVSKLFEGCPGITLNLGFSIDGIGKEHDRVRETPDNYRLMSRTIDEVVKLKDKYPNLSLKAHTVISRENIGQFDFIADEVKKLGVSMHTFDFVRPAAGNEGQDLHALSIQEVRDLLPRIHANNRRYSGYDNLHLHSAIVKETAMAVLDHNYDLYPEFMEKQTQVIDCQAPERNLVLDAYGNLGFCELREWIGNLRNCNLNADELLRSPQAQRLRESIRKKECSCFHPCYQQVNVLFTKKELAKALFKRAKFLLKR